MAAELKPHLRLEIAYVLFIDIVGYSKLLIDEQKELLQKLNEIVRKTDQVRAAEAEGKLVRLPTGDGMALVFSNNPEAPVECALEISKALQNHPEIKLRMGIHSGAVNQIADVNDRSNVAGAGINIAQRVMDCGDAGHILLSKHVAEDLAQYRHWQPYLHDLGECEVKHGDRVSVVNLYTEELGNPAIPERFSRVPPVEAAVTAATPPSTSKPAVPRWLLVVAAVLVLGTLAIGLLLFQSKRSPTTASTSTAIPEKSIAVLPFENLSANQENAFFTDGVQDEILTELAKIADLKVISRTSVMQYKSGVVRNLREIGKQLGVAHLLEGSVQRVGGKVRVNAQLIDARTDGHLWAENYDRPLDDVFAIQSEIAKTIATQLQAKLSPSEKAAIEKPPTRDIEAYDLYLRAKTLEADSGNPVASQEKVPHAVRILKDALGRDPKFLRAWTLLSRLHGLFYFEGNDHSAGRLEQARAAVEEAQRLSPDAGETHLAQAEYLYWGFRDYPRARAELAAASRSLPNDPEVFALSGYIDRRDGRWQDATRNLERAMELNPRDFRLLIQVVLLYQRLHRYNDAIRISERALVVVPGDPNTRMQRAELEVDWRGDIKVYQTTLASVLAEDPTRGPEVDDPYYAVCERTASAAKRMIANIPPEGFATNGTMFPKAYVQGFIERCQGNDAAGRASFAVARPIVEQKVREQPNLAIALSLLGMIDAGLGRKDEAIREGRRACEMLPPTKDALDGLALQANLAQIYAWTGEKDAAIAQIAEVERAPNLLSYGFLKLSPVWDPLRSDPRFERIVSSLAPK
jgi:TolB-like protein/class 3 adenylate cyclase